MNSLVDVGNWCSLDYLLPICVYDKDKIFGNVTIRKGKENESYTGLNRREVNLHNRYVISDETGPFGSPMTDSTRTAVTLNTAKVILVIFAPEDYDTELLTKQSETFVERAKMICGGSLKSMDIIYSTNP